VSESHLLQSVIFKNVSFYHFNPLSAKWRACMTWKHGKRNHKWVKLKW